MDADVAHEGPSPSDPPDLSVVIPTHDRAGLLPLALGGALRQRGVAMEVIIVDDGSTDNTRDVLGAVDDPRVRVVPHDAPTGVSAARNDGVALARAPWVAFLDDDDVWAPDKLRLQLDALRASDARWAYVGAVNVSLGHRVVGGTAPPSSEEVAASIRARNVVPGGCSGVVASTDLVRASGGFDTSLAALADWDLWLRLAADGAPTSVDRPLVGYRVHAGNLSLEIDAVLREFDVVAARSGAGERATLYRYLGWWVLRAGRLGAAARFFTLGAVRRDGDYPPSAYLRDLSYLTDAASRRTLARVGVRLAPRDRVPSPIDASWRDEAQRWIDDLVDAVGRGDLREERG
jgi:glycosyltransferase involved in cell wall biosynthesis